MKKNVVIVESPTKAKTIARFLGKNFRVLSSMGHIRDLPPKRFGVDVRDNFKPKYIIPSKSRKTVKVLKSAVSGASDLYLATDLDREGEAIANHIIIVTKPKIEPKRIKFDQITPSAIKYAINHPQRINVALVDAQQTRRILDRIVGYRLSPFLWRKVAQGLSAGRVQSVAVRLIVDREKEIKKFKPQEYWQIIAHLVKIKGEKKDLGLEIKAILVETRGKKIDRLDIKNKNQAQNIISDLKDAIYKIIDIKKDVKKRFPPPAYTTATLQQDAATRLGFSAKKTMGIAQGLYEGINCGKKGRIGLITYMRTDSVHLSSQSLKKTKTVIERIFGTKYALLHPRRYKTRSKTAQEAHEAIRPTYPEIKPEDVRKYLDGDQYRLYDIIWKRMIATQMKEAEVESEIIDIAAKKYLFRAQGEKIKFDGYLKLYDIKYEKYILPKLVISERLKLIKLESLQKFTEPPTRYTEGTLIKALELQGIGRPSTYAPIISTILERGYVKLEGKFFIPEQIGVLVSDLLVKHFPEIVDIKFTAKIEDELDDVAAGKKERNEVLTKFYQPFAQNLAKKEKQLKKEDIAETPTRRRCPKCRKRLIIKYGKYGKFLSCSSYPKCDYSEPLVEKDSRRPEEKQKKAAKQYANEKCEKCGAKLIFKEGRFGVFLACSRYPKCKFTKGIIKGIGMKCPECREGDVIERRTKTGKVFWGCNRYPKCKWGSWENPKKVKKLNS